MNFQVYDFRDAFNLHEIVSLCIGVGPTISATHLSEASRAEYGEVHRAAAHSAVMATAECARAHMCQQHWDVLHPGLLYPGWCLERLSPAIGEAPWTKIPDGHWPEAGFDPGTVDGWTFAREVIAAWLKGRSFRPVYDFSVVGGVVAIEKTDARGLKPTPYGPESTEERQRRRLDRLHAIGGDRRRRSDGGWQASGKRGALAALAKEEEREGRQYNDVRDVARDLDVEAERRRASRTMPRD